MPTAAAIPAIAAAAIGAVISAGISAGVSQSQQSDAKETAQNERTRQEGLLKQSQDNAKALEDATNARDQAKQRQLAGQTAAAASGGSPTSTSALGLLGNYALGGGTKKTIGG